MVQQGGYFLERLRFRSRGRTSVQSRDWKRPAAPRCRGVLSLDCPEGAAVEMPGLGPDSLDLQRMHRQLEFRVQGMKGTPLFPRPGSPGNERNPSIP